jgi:hypothetical protein
MSPTNHCFPLSGHQSLWIWSQSISMLRTWFNALTFQTTKTQFRSRSNTLTLEQQRVGWNFFNPSRLLSKKRDDKTSWSYFHHPQGPSNSSSRNWSLKVWELHKQHWYSDNFPCFCLFWCHGRRDFCYFIWQGHKKLIPVTRKPENLTVNLQKLFLSRWKKVFSHTFALSL